MNLALCYERLGKTATSWSIWLDGAAEAAAKGQVEREALARRRAAMLESRLLRITIIVAPQQNLDAIDLQVDGVSLPKSRWGAPTPVDPGRHWVLATAEGRLPWRTTIEVDDQHVPLVQIGVLEKPAPSVPAAAPPATTSPATVPGGLAPRKTAALLLGGAGIVALGAMSALGLVARSTYLNASCSNLGCDKSGLVDCDYATTEAGLATAAGVTARRSARRSRGALVWCSHRARDVERAADRRRARLGSFRAGGVVMGRRRSWARHAVAAVLGAVLVTAAGCGDLLGFQDSVRVQCVLPSDCGVSSGLVCKDGFCTPECKGNYDCQRDSPDRPVCVGGSCVASAPTVGDSSLETADAPSEASDGASEGSSGPDASPDSETAIDAAEGGTCDPACSTFSVCRDQVCLGVTDEGWASPTGQMMEAVEQGYLQAIQITWIFVAWRPASDWTLCSRTTKASDWPFTATAGEPRRAHCSKPAGDVRSRCQRSGHNAAGVDWLRRGRRLLLVRRRLVTGRRRIRDRIDPGHHQVDRRVRSR